jgi:predicted acyl esterase
MTTRSSNDKPARRQLRVIQPVDTTLDGYSACRDVRGGVTDEEVAVLNEMRALKQQVTAARASLDALADGDPQRPGAQARLAELREQWQALEQRRDAARVRRMELLGHFDDQ